MCEIYAVKVNQEPVSCSNSIFLVGIPASELDLIKILLETQGYRVVAVGIDQAVEQIAQEQPDLILLDLTMLRSQSDGLIHQIRQLPQDESIPILVILDNESGNIVPSDITGWIRKPYIIDYLLARIEELLPRDSTLVSP